MERFFPETQATWVALQDLPNKAFVCGYCTISVSSIRGNKLANTGSAQIGAVYIRPNCGGPVFFDAKRVQYPSPALGASVQHVPEPLNALYDEARRCTAQNCFTAAVLVCRKILMHIAVEESAEEGLNFLQYVNYLSDNGYLPPNGKHWVDHIRKKGNEANHEIVLMSATDARLLLTFVEMLLRFVYEFQI